MNSQPGMPPDRIDLQDEQDAARRVGEPGS
jgi:hypothetical protein